MSDKLSSELFLHAKALIIANDLRTDMRRLQNICATIGNRNHFSELLDAVETSVTTIHDEINAKYDNVAKQVDTLADDLNAPFFDTEADNDPADEEFRTSFVEGHWYQGRIDDRPVKVYICSRFNGANGKEIVADVNDNEYIFPVMISVSNFLHGKATEMVHGTMVDYDLDDEDEDDDESDFIVYSINHLEMPE